MFGNMFSAAKRSETKATGERKRRHPRRVDDRCVSVINGQMHPVENWSSGGMMVTADERLFALGQDCIFTLKFKLRDEIMEVDHKAKVVRKAPNKIALQFLPLSKKVQTGFQ